MQKFQFKLNGLLKVREFKEKKIKIELGEVLKEITSVEEMIAKLHRDIDETYKAQEDLMKDPAAGKMIQFFPYVNIQLNVILEMQRSLKFMKELQKFSVL